MSEESTVASSESSVEATLSPSPVAAPEVPAQVHSPSPTAAYSFMDHVPEEYRNNEYVTRAAKESNPVGELIKHMSTLSQTLATTPSIPKADATPEEKANWARMVAPTEATAYEGLKPVLPEGEASEALTQLVDSTFTPELLGDITTAAMEVGIAPWQLKNVMDKVNANQLGVIKSVLQQQETERIEQDKNFDEVMAKSFGKDQPKVLELGKQFLRENVPAHLQPHLASLSNEGLAVVAAIAYQAHKKYGGEDTIPLGGTASLATDKAGMDKLIAEAMSDKAYTNPMLAEHDAARAKVKGLLELYVKKGYS